MNACVRPSKNQVESSHARDQMLPRNQNKGILDTITRSIALFLLSEARSVERLAERS